MKIMNNKNCIYCDDSEDICAVCNKTIICDECYNIIAPYLDEDEPRYKIYTCNSCADLYPNQKTIKQG